MSNQDFLHLEKSQTKINKIIKFFAINLMQSNIKFYCKNANLLLR